MNAAHAPSLAEIAALVDHAAHLLPSQAPLPSFVHHNPLHAFEHLPFETAVVEAGKLYGTEPFPQERFFADQLRTGRIRRADVEAVVQGVGAAAEPLFAGAPSPREFMVQRLLHLFPVPEAATVEWLLAETPVLEELHDQVASPRRERLVALAALGLGPKQLLPRLWDQLHRAAFEPPSTEDGPRPRDRIVTRLGIDPDAWVHPTLIRICAAFLDQGVAYWSMPRREQGLLSATRRLYGLRLGPPQRWMRGLREALRRQHDEHWTAEQTVRWALETLAVPPDRWPEVIEATLLSLRGWAGMIRHFEERPERAPVRALPCRLLDYLAVQLTLDVFATEHALREARGSSATPRVPPPAPAAGPRTLSLTYEAFALAQLLMDDPVQLLAADRARAWVDLVRGFDDGARRALLHAAYERRHRAEVLDGLLAHEGQAPTRPPAAAFQAVFCIDDREESTRRHLEESCPDAETFGYAGFFGVAMAYQGLQDPRPRPLCPPVVKPRHVVRECCAEPGDAALHRRSQRTAGAVSRGVRVSSQTLVRGGLLTSLAGLAAMVPLVGRSLFPRHFARMTQQARAMVTSAALPRTRLALERDASDASAGPVEGFTADEMADIVENGLRTTGLRPTACTLVLVIGHGSSSLNNPHEAAYDCGATGGGRGGPNARAFAQMANHPRVRQILRERGCELPAESWFVGAYHDTCNDSMTYYDEDLVPAQVAERYARAKEALARACSLDAHERCRRFESAPRRARPAEALGHVHGRALDLAQPRPELGHATNAVCIVGRRHRTRGLFLDRRAFLVSYDPTTDFDGGILAGLLSAVGPVGAGINLEYYFSFIDPVGYGAGSKLPHNIVGLFGVMDGHASDLRTGLPWQMVEIHEPVRLLLVVEAEPEALLNVLARNPGIDRLARNRWIQLVAWSPGGAAMHVFENDRFVPYSPESTELPRVARSAQHYEGAGARAHLRLVQVHSAS